MSDGFRIRALRGDRLLGTVLACPDPALAEIAASRFDFVWVDLEHSALTVRDVQSLAIAAAPGATLVRMPSATSALLTAVLDAGVAGVVAPRVEAVEEAAAFGAALRYPPVGRRGIAHRRATGYGAAPRGPEPLGLIQIESRAAVERAEELARVPGIDGLIVGPNDLALDLGVAPDLREPALAAAIAAVRAAGRRARVLTGIAAAGDVAVVAGALGDDSTLLAYSVDVRLYADAVTAAANGMRAAWA